VASDPAIPRKLLGEPRSRGSERDTEKSRGKIKRVCTHNSTTLLMQRWMEIESRNDEVRPGIVIKWSGESERVSGIGDGRVRTVVFELQKRMEGRRSYI
jgi:hypothetical protein